MKVLKAVGKQLYTLRFSTIFPEKAKVVAKHCPGLRELCLNCNWNSLNVLLPILGAQLLKLEITDHFLNDADFELIRTLCHALEVINLNVPAHLYGALARLLASYGAHLKQAHLRHMDLQDVQVVAYDCHNVKEKIHVWNPQVLNVLGSRAHTVSLSIASANLWDIRSAVTFFI